MKPTAFREALEHCAHYLSSQLDKPLIELLFHGKETTLDKTQYTQPVLFAWSMPYSSSGEFWRRTGCGIRA